MMKQLIIMACLIGSFAFMGCEEGQKQPQNVEEAAEQAKDLIDVFSKKAKKLLDDEDGIDKIKGLIDSVALKSENIEKFVKENKGEWKTKIDKIKDDPKLKDALKDFGGGTEDLVKQLEGIVNGMSDKVKDGELPKDGQK